MDFPGPTTRRRHPLVLRRRMADAAAPSGVKLPGSRLRERSGISLEVATASGCNGSAMYQLSEHEAFEAMTRFLAEFYGRAGNDMETLLADITLEADGTTLDPAAWDDWMRIVRGVKGE